MQLSTEQKAGVPLHSQLHTEVLVNPDRVWARLDRGHDTTCETTASAVARWSEVQGFARTDARQIWLRAPARSSPWTVPYQVERSGTRDQRVTPEGTPVPPETPPLTYGPATTTGHFQFAANSIWSAPVLVKAHLDTPNPSELIPIEGDHPPSASETSTSVLTVLPVELFADNQNSGYQPGSEALGVSNYITTDGLPIDAQFHDTCADPENFRLQARMANATTASVVVKLEVIRGTTVISTRNYTLDKKEGNMLRGEFLRLAADSNDAAASGNGETSDPNHQTILVKLGDKVQASYDFALGHKIEHEIQVGRPQNEDNNDLNPKKHDIREVKVRVIVVNNNISGVPCVSEAQVTQDIEDANERLAQAGIRIKRTVIPAEVIGTPPGFGGAYIGSNNYVTLGSADERIFVTLKDGEINTVDMFYVPSIIDTGNGERAISYFKLKNQSGDSSYNNWCVVSASNAGGGKPNTVAHELMHIMLNLGHRVDPVNPMVPWDPASALFRGSTSLNKNVDSTKRIGPYPDSAVLGVGHNDTNVLRGNAETLP